MLAAAIAVALAVALAVVVAVFLAQIKLHTYIAIDFVFTTNIVDEKLQYCIKTSKISN